MTQTIDIGRGVHIACTLSGSGPPLLLMHGAEGSHRMFDAIAPCLASSFRVIAYDQRDCGESRNPAGPTTLADLAHDAAALLDALGVDESHVYGTSFGGRVAQAMAHLHPKRVRRLVLGSTWPLPFGLAELNPDGVRDILALREGLPDSAQALAGYFLPPEFLAQRPVMKDIFRSVAPSSPRSQERQRTLSDCPSLRPDEITVSTLLMAGSLDRVVPPQLTLSMAREIRYSQQVLFEGVGHAGALQEPALLADRIRRFCLGAEDTAGWPT